MRDDQGIVDANGLVVKVGDTVLFGDPKTSDEIAAQTGVVFEITDYDVDYNDDLMRAEQYPPKVKIRLPNGDVEMTSTHDATPISWAEYPDGPDVWIFQADDIVMVAHAEETT